MALLATGVFVATLAWSASRGLTVTLVMNAVLDALLNAAWPGAVYLVSAIGLGWLVSPLWRGAREAIALQAAVGLGLMLTLSHGLGVAGLLTTPITVGLALVGIGVAMWQVATALRRRCVRTLLAASPRLGWWMLALPAAAIMTAAALSPPGVLWSSEFGGYDALSYHLTLPQEWHRTGQITPVAHNVYSALPSYMEAAFTHLAALTGSPRGAFGDGASHDPAGLLAADGRGVLAAQLLHVMIAVLAAWLVGRVVARCASRAGVRRSRARIGAGLAAGLVLATPWTVVVGSLAYNEMAVVALGAGAMLAAIETRITPWRRGVLVGLLVGAACGAKPTAIFMITPVAGVLAIAAVWNSRARTSAPVRSTVVVLGCATIAGAIMLAPWMLRNWAVLGNPVFPAATGVFGDGPWTAEQHARWAHGHAFDGDWGDRLRVAVWRDLDAGDGASDVVRWRGVFNPQWAALFPTAIAVGLVGVCARRTRWIATALLVGLGVQLVAWVALTHIQSRFLLPCVGVCAALVGLGAIGPRCTMRRRVFTAVGVLAMCVQIVATVRVWLGENNGVPAIAVPYGVDWFTGRDPQAREGDFAPPAWVNQNIPANRVVLLVGDATPFYFTGSVQYNTTWNRSPLIEAINNRLAADGWVQELAADGIDYVLIDFGELARLRASGWLDPALSETNIRELVRTLGPPAHVWRNGAVVLFRVPEVTR